MTYYFAHHESGCVWTQDHPLLESETDGLVGEIEEARYRQLLAEGYTESLPKFVPYWLE